MSNTKKPIEIHVHAKKPLGELQPLWNYFGYDEANYTFTDEGRSLLAKLSSLSEKPTYIRTHHLLTSGNGETWLKWSSSGVYREDKDGNPIYAWSILDRVFDGLHELGIKPLVEIGFMPEVLSVSPGSYTPAKILNGDISSAGLVGGGAFYPPKDYLKWEALIEAWVGHCVERYGSGEVSTWLWELWNEPDAHYWQGTLEEYLRLWDHTVSAIRRSLPQARVGGPHVTNPTSAESERYLRSFIKHCKHIGALPDFLAFHAKGGTELKDDHAFMNAANHLHTIDRGCEIVSSLTDGIPVIVGESDPDGCAACSAANYPQNRYRNGAQYASYTAATFLRKQAVAERHGVALLGAVTWAFLFPEQPWFHGYRTLSTHGVNKPVYNAFQMFNMLPVNRVEVVNSCGRDLIDLMLPESRGTADVDAVAAAGQRELGVIIWHHHDSGIPGDSIAVELTIHQLGASSVTYAHYRIDDTHSNAYTTWRHMGAPQSPSPDELSTLEESSVLALFAPPETLTSQDSTISISVKMPRHSVSLVKLSW